MSQANPTGPEIEYPCRWRYRLIGTAEDALRAAVADFVGEREFDLSHSHTSRKGTYVSLVLTLVVRTEEERLELYQQLSEHPSTRMVL